MKQITYSRGFWYLVGFLPDEVPPWVTETHTGSYYFHLNSVTRAYFRDDILPMIRANKISIRKEDLETIRTYEDVHANRYVPAIIPPDGITLKDYQVTAVTKMLTHNKFGIFLGTGTGKTLIAITFLLSRGIRTRTLIVTPKKVIDQYKSQLDKYIPGNNIDVINYESVHKYSNNMYDCVILDESHKVKNYTSNVNRVLRTITKNACYVFLFTGTPQDAKRSEIFPQLAILDEKYMPGKTRFINRYFHLDDYYNPRSEKKQFSKELTAVIEAVTWGKKSEEVIQLSPEHHTVIECEHPGENYDTLAKHRILRLDNLDVVADNKAILRTKLRQISSGHVTGITPDTNETVRVLLNNTKYIKLQALITTLPSAIIYTEYDMDMEIVVKCLVDTGKTFGCISGSTHNPQEIIDDFLNKRIEFLVMQNKSGNAGLDLTCTYNMIFYTLPESHIVFTQCKARIQRLGQTNDCNYYYLLCKNTVEEDIYYKALTKKKSYSDKLFLSYIDN